MTARLERLSVREPWLTDALVAAGIVVVSGIVGVATASSSPVAVLPIAALAAALLMTDGRARTIFVVFGGLLILQRGEGLDMTKFAFFAGAGVSFAGAFLNVRRMHPTPIYQLARPLLAVSVAFFALGAVSLAIAHTNGIGLVAWLRDAVPYLLFASAPIFALDAQTSFGRKGLVALLVIAGTMAALLFGLGWLERRHVSNLGLGSLGLASVIMPAALFSLAMSAALQADVRRPRWLILAGVILALLVMTGTRTTFVLLVAPLAIALGARPKLVTRSMRLAVLGPVTLTATLLFGVAFIGISGADTEMLQKRIEILKETGDTSGDASYNERREQTEIAWDRFESAPIVGAGPGTTFEWKTQNGIPVSSSLLDTPLVFPAKFGLLGLAVCAFVLAKYWSFLRRLRRLEDVGIGQLALTGYLAVVLAITPLVLPFDDKGFSFGLILVLALALQEARAKLRAPLPRPDSRT
jgi:hypothetical protein